MSEERHPLGMIDLTDVTPKQSAALANLGDHLADMAEHYEDADRWAWQLMASLARQVAFAELMMRDVIAFERTRADISELPEVER